MPKLNFPQLLRKLVSKNLIIMFVVEWSLKRHAKSIVDQYKAGFDLSLKKKFKNNCKNLPTLKI